MNPVDFDETDALAGEYVLGLLPPDEAAAVERAAAADPVLAARIGFWRDRLMGLAATVEPVAPSPELWRRIARDLMGPPVPAPPGRFRLLWQSLQFWRLAAGGAAFAAAMLAAVMVVRPEAVPRPIAVTVLQATDASPGWVVEAYADGRLQLMPLAATLPESGRALELWTLIDRARGPVSLGLVRGDRPSQVDFTRLPPPEPGQLFEISLEPATGSPTGRPTGPVLFKGNVVRPPTGS